MRLKKLNESWKHFNEIDCEKSFRRYRKLIEYYLINEPELDYERHHILPRSLFPRYAKSDWNIVKLPFRAHFLAHYLLYRFYPTVQTAMAFNLMTQRIGKPNSKLYEKSRKEILKKIGDNSRGKRWIYNPQTGVRHFTRNNLPEGWVVGVPDNVRDKMKSVHTDNLWWFNPSTGIQQRSKTNPGEGWVLGRRPFNNAAFRRVNSMKKVINLRLKEFILKGREEELEEWELGDQGRSLEAMFLLVKDNIVYTQGNVPIATSRRFRGNFPDYTCPEPHPNMTKWNYEFCKENSGKTLKNLGFAVYSAKEFVWRNGYVIERRTREETIKSKERSNECRI